MPSQESWSTCKFLCIRTSTLSNSRCPCKETPLTTGWKLHIFTRTLLWPEKLFPQSVDNARYDRHSKSVSVCYANWIELSVWAYTSILHDRGFFFFFLKTTFGWSAGKNNPDFVHFVNGVSLCTATSVIEDFPWSFVITIAIANSSISY